MNINKLKSEEKRISRLIKKYSGNPEYVNSLIKQKKDIKQAINILKKPDPRPLPPEFAYTGKYK